MKYCQILVQYKTKRKSKAKEFFQKKKKKERWKELVNINWHFH